MLAQSLFVSALLTSALSLQVAKQEVKKEKCGVVLGAFGKELYTKAGAIVAERIRALNATKGWCPEDPQLDYIPVALFTDDAKLIGECPKGVTCIPDTHMAQSEEITSAAKGKIRPGLGSWKFRWYHAQMMVSSPYELGIYLDLDAVPCSGDKLGDLLKRLREKKAAVGTLIHSNWPCLQTGNDCSKGKPEGAHAGDWAKFKERNGGVIVFDRERAKPFTKTFGDYIVKSTQMSKIWGDQYALRAALFLTKDSVPELTYKNDELCRYGGGTCKSGCAVYHKNSNWKQLQKEVGGDPATR